MPGDSKTTPSATAEIFNMLIRRAEEIDPEAWAAPLPRRLESRRVASVAQAQSEMKTRMDINVR